MASIDEDFPRGGSDKKASEPKPKPAKPRVDTGNLFENQEPETKKKKKAAAKQKETKTQETAAAGLKLNTSNTVDILHLKNLKVGTFMLGSVKEVSDFEVVVGLPDGLRGFLPISGICDAYNKILSEKVYSGNDLEDLVSPSHLLGPGLLVRCVVSSLQPSKEGFVSLRVSINPKEVNKELSATSLKAGMTLGGCVESVEDHGFLIDIGVIGTKAFLPRVTKKNGAKSLTQDLKVGQYVTALLQEVQNAGRVVRLTLDPAAVTRARAEPEHGWTLNSLLPGLLVQAHVKKVTAHGLIVTFLSSYSGMVDFMHIDPDKASKYSIGDEVMARILYVEPSSRLIGLSMRRHLLPPGGDVLERAQSERIGEVLQGCKMTALHHHAGAIMTLPDGTSAFIHKNQMKEPKEEFNGNKQFAQPEHTVRITDYSPLEQMHLATLRKSIISETFFSYSDLRVGQLIEGTVQSLQKQGMYVNISNHIKGLVPRIHLADVVLSNPDKKFKEGMRVMCRVLSLDLLNKKLILTRKKALIESQLPVLSTYADAWPGLVAHGCVVAIKNFGCIVRFYGDVKGLVPTAELTTEPTINAQGLFYIGQVVKAQVLKCDAEAGKLLLSFRMVTQEDGEQKHTATFDFEVGKKVEAVVLRKDLAGLQVSVLPEEVPALLPTVHLSDHVTNCPLLWAGLQEGDTISNAVCLSKNKQSITLSKKPLLMAALEAGAMVTAFSELKVGTIMLGWVKSIMTFGVFVDFPHGLCGLAPKATMSDKFMTDIAEVFQVGQTVMAKVTNLDEEKHRFLVSLRMSDVSVAKGDAQSMLIQGQRERRAALDMMTSRGDSELPSISVGDKLKMTVGEPTEDGSVTLISDQLCGISVLASKYHTTGVNTTPGCQVKAVVLHVDLVTSQMYVSLLPLLTEKKKKLEKGAHYTATVQYVDRDFAVISLGNTGHLTMVSMTTHLNETFRFESEKMSVGQNLTVTVIDPRCEDLGGQSLVELQVVAAQHGHQTSVGKGGKRSYEIGHEVTVVVKKIKPKHVLVTLPDGYMGRVHVSQIQDSPREGSFPTSSLKVGSEMKAQFIGSHEARSFNYLPISHPSLVYMLPQLTLLPSKMKGDADVQPQKDEPQYTPGEDFKCFVSKYIPEKKCLELAMSESTFGKVELLAMTTRPREANHPQKLFKCGQCITAKVVGFCKNTQQHQLSLIGIHKLMPGNVVMGMVQEINHQNGLVLKLPFGKTGLVSMTDLSDAYTDNPLVRYKEGQLVRCCVIGKTKSQLTLSLRLSRIHDGKPLPVIDVDISSVSELSEGQILRGYVKNIGEKGIFVRLSRSIIGRVLIQKATNYFVNDSETFTKYIPQNALVTAKVLHADAESGHVDLSLLPEDTGKADVLPESLGFPLRQTAKDKKHNKNHTKRKRSDSESMQDEATKTKRQKKGKHAAEKGGAEEMDSGVDVYFREEETNQAKKKGKKRSSQEHGRLQVASAFCWDVALSSLQPASATDAMCESSSEDEGDQSKPVKSSRHELKQERQEAERKLSKLEAELQDPAVRPESSAQFERLLLSSPDSSLLWLQYMAFHLQATQIEQARAVAERALRTISFREEQEKLNVWVALLNLENMYGTAESLKKVFERAVQYCEPVHVYQQLADIYAKSGKVKEAEGLYKNMMKRFRQEKAVWQSYGAFLLQQGQSDAANALLQRALQSLSTKEHVDLITKFARLEFQYGNSERGKAMFEKVLGSYPKRTDVWSIFIDITVKHGSQKDIRDLFDRVIHLSVSVKKVKFFFKRYLDYEKQHGTPESIQAVKQKALEYVESKGSEATS